MIDQLIEWDKELFLWLNGFHADWLDPIMLFITERNSWIPLYLVIIALIVWKLKWRCIPLLLGFGLLILIADQLASGFFKPYFGRLRPCHEPDFQGLVHMIKGCGGRYGFASSHASNTVAVGAFIYLLTRNVYGKLMIAWAVVVSYSRIYAGVHYPADILVGAALGVFAAFVVYFLYKRLFLKDLQEIHRFV